MHHLCAQMKEVLEKYLGADDDLFDLNLTAKCVYVKRSSADVFDAISWPLSHLCVSVLDQFKRVKLLLVKVMFALYFCVSVTAPAMWDEPFSKAHCSFR